MDADQQPADRRPAGIPVALAMIIIGAGLLTAAAALVAPIAGLGVAGALLLAGGLDLARGARS